MIRNVLTSLLGRRGDAFWSNSTADAVLEAMNEGYVVQGPSGEIQEFNLPALEILGLTEDQLLGRTSSDPRWKALKEDGSEFPGEEHPAMVVLRTGKPMKGVVMGIGLPDGSRRWISINSVPRFARDGDRKPIAAVTTFLDITVLKESNLELNRITQRLQIASRAVRFGVWDWNLKSGALYWDDFMYELFGIDRGDFKGNYDAFEKTLLPEDRDRVNSEIQATVAARSPIFKSEFRVATKVGEIRNIAAQAQCFYDAHGQIERIVGNNWDITETVQKAQMIQAQQAKLVESAKMASLGEMAGSIAHEINNPLAIIQARATMLQHQLDQGKCAPEAARTHTLKISQTCDRIARIIRGLKNFSRNAENDPLVRISVKTIVEETLELCSERFRHHGVTIENQVHEDIWIMGQPTQLSQVLLNLLSNSFDAIEKNPTRWVRIACQSTSDDRIVLTVTDSGSGIPEPVRRRMMEPFFTTKEIGKGTGLGLSISKGIIEQHGGRLAVDEKNPNTCFVISLPKADPVKVAEGSTEQDAPLKQAA